MSRALPPLAHGRVHKYLPTLRGCRLFHTNWPGLSSLGSFLWGTAAGMEKIFSALIPTWP
jgi:hypothetical protein